MNVGGKLWNDGHYNVVKLYNCGQYYTKYMSLSLLIYLKFIKSYRYWAYFKYS